MPLMKIVPCSPLLNKAYSVRVQIKGDPVTIAPIVKTVFVSTSPGRAFDLFTTQIGNWWPVGRTVGKSPCETVIPEPRQADDGSSAKLKASKRSGASCSPGNLRPACCWSGSSTRSSPSTQIC